MGLGVKLLGRHPGGGGLEGWPEKVAFAIGKILVPPVLLPWCHTKNVFHYMAKGSLQVKLRLIINYQ